MPFLARVYERATLSSIGRCSSRRRALDAAVSATACKPRRRQRSETTRRIDFRAGSTLRRVETHASALRP